MNFEQNRKKAEQLRTVPLTSVLQIWGARPDPHDPHKWHTPRGVLSVTGTKFINWKRGLGGGGAIDLVIHLGNFGFKEALAWLERHFSGSIPPPAPSLFRPNLKLPPPEPAQLGRVRHYLLYQRRLIPTLIDPLIQSGTLYADHSANAVFLLRGKQNNPVGAELRGTTQASWRGMAPGSQKNLGFFSIPALPLSAIILCESAIDAISCFALHPQHRCISTAGARPDPDWLPSLMAQSSQVYCGFDADPTGEAMASAMIALHPSIQRLVPPRHDWNDTLRSRL